MSYSRPLERLVAALVVALVVLPVAHAPPAGASASEEPDCLFLLAVLDRVLGHAVSGDPEGAVVAGYMLNASVPKDVALVHERVYRLISDYYVAVVLRGDIGLPRLRKLLSELSEVPAYVDRLSRCSHDPEAARTLRTKVLLKLDALSGSVNRLLEDRALETCGWIFHEVSPRRGAYSPGDELHVSVRSPTSGVSVELYTWPQLRLVAQSSQCWDSDCLFEVRVPEARSLVERGISADLVMRFALLARVGSSTCFLGLLRVDYRTPSLIINVPRTVKRGDAVSVAIHSGEDYEISVYLNDVLVYSGTASSSGVLLELSTLEDPVRTGLNTLRVCANASTKTVPYCFRSTFAVEPRYPRVELHLPRVSVSWLGYVTISLVNEERAPVDSTVSVNGVWVYRGLLEGAEPTTITFFAGYLPVLRASVDVRLRALAEGYDELVAHREVICVSILPSIAIAFAALAVPLLVFDVERSFMVSIKSMFRAAEVSRRLSKAKGLAKVLEPYVLGLGSSIASLYYSLLRRLRVRLPLDQETLREHFSSSIESLSLSGRVKKLLWALLVLVERDLYSKRKPDDEEARRLYKGVLSEAGE